LETPPLHPNQGSGYEDDSDDQSSDHQGDHDDEGSDYKGSSNSEPGSGPDWGGGVQQGIPQWASLVQPPIWRQGSDQEYNPEHDPDFTTDSDPSSPPKKQYHIGHDGPLVVDLKEDVCSLKGAQPQCIELKGDLLASKFSLTG
jgi:hypothetical protein